MNHEKSGLVLLDKNPGVTSFQVLSPLKKTLGTMKVGHAGTLDKFAEGLLIVLIGKMTKLASLFTEYSKTYRTTVRFGLETDTLDPEGDVVKESGIPSSKEVEKAIADFHGEIDQVPPLYSAVHVKGERAYRLARSGKTATLKPRKVTIYDLELLDYTPPDLTLRVVCSKGTYVRSLARDIAYKCGAGGYVSHLVREKIGPFFVKDAVTVDRFEPKRDILGPYGCFQAIPEVSIAIVPPQIMEDIKHGREFNPGRVEGLRKKNGLVAFFGEDGEFAALAEKEESKIAYKFVGI